MNKRRIFLPLLTAQLILMTACGNEAVPDGGDEIPSMTVSQGFGYLETTEARLPTVTVTTEGFLPPDMTGTELATTYTDEYGNVYGITSPMELPDPVISNDGTGYVITDNTAVSGGNDLSLFPDIDLSDYYLHTDPANTFTLPTQTVQTYTTTPGTSYSPFSVSESSSMMTAAPTFTTTTTVPETTVTETTTTSPAAVQVTDDELAASRNAVIPSKYRSNASEVMHTYSYNSLTDTQKYVYDVVTAAALNYDRSVKFPINRKVTFDDLFAAYQTLYLDEVRLYYIDTVMEYVTDRSTDYITDMNISYIYTGTQVENMNAEMAKAEAEILSGVTPSMSEYETVKYIHDALIQRCTYTLDGSDITSPYGAMVRGTAQCQGYSRAFSYLCNLCGIETDIVLGVANEEHMWNMAKINGKWYHIDLTWDDPDRTDFPDSVRYDYFCVSTDRMQELRVIEGNSHDIPTADSDDLEYYTYNNLVAGSLEEAKRIYRSEALKASQTRSSTVQFRCASSEVYEDVVAAFFTNGAAGNVLDLTDEVNKTAVNKFNSNTISHSANLDTLIVKIMLSY